MLDFSNIQSIQDTTETVSLGNIVMNINDNFSFCVSCSETTEVLLDGEGFNLYYYDFYNNVWQLETLLFLNKTRHWYQLYNLSSTFMIEKTKTVKKVGLIIYGIAPNTKRFVS